MVIARQSGQQLDIRQVEDVPRLLALWGAFMSARQHHGLGLLTTIMTTTRLINCRRSWIPRTFQRRAGRLGWRSREGWARQQLRRAIGPRAAAIELTRRAESDLAS